MRFQEENETLTFYIGPISIFTLGQNISGFFCQTVWRTIGVSLNKIKGCQVTNCLEIG